MGMEQAVKELKGLQAQMEEFQTSQNFVVALLTKMESQILRLEQLELDTKDKEQVEEKDVEPLTE